MAELGATRGPDVGGQPGDADGDDTVPARQLSDERVNAGALQEAAGDRTVDATDLQAPRGGTVDAGALQEPRAATVDAATLQRQDRTVPRADGRHRA